MAKRLSRPPSSPLRARRAAILAGIVGGQRKQVTVLFADLVDFTALSRRIDAEDVRLVVNSYFSCWRQVIEQPSKRPAELVRGGAGPQLA